MKAAEDSLYPPDWIRVAEQDWQRILIRLDFGDPEDASFHLQQALEKYLKAFLLSRGWKLQKIHDLAVLLKSTFAYKPEWERFLGLCERVDSYYFLDRYPSTLDAGTDSDEIRQDFEAAHELREVMLREFQPTSQT